MGERVLDRSLEEGDSDLERDREGTDAEDGDRERLRLLLGGVRESERDLDRLGDRLDFRLRVDRGVLTLDESADAVRFDADDAARLKSDERWSPLLLPAPPPTTTASM